MDSSVKVSSTQMLAAFADMARKDPHTIPSILKSAFGTIENSMHFSQLFMSLLFGTEQYSQHLKELAIQADSLQSICARGLEGSDLAWKCETCEMDPT